MRREITLSFLLVYAAVTPACMQASSLNFVGGVVPAISNHSYGNLIFES